MNKKELIERIECLKNIFGNKNEYVKIDMVVELISELDEPQPVKVPQFVADWIEECEAKEKTLLNSLLYTPEGVNSWVGNSDNQETFARAWLDGYEVEEENQYAVTLKNRQPLVKSQSGSILYFSQDITAGNYKITRKELEDADFGWVFDCPGIEIEEVE